ncbi:HNH endonuclease [Nonomuraea fuscirosea]|uniref:HNH endonuclease n=1 Tax=Nonomuraea fuscirosea TaxID=1291556 RepID=UPI0037AC961A
MPPRTRPLAERFWEKVDKGPGCWLWKGVCKSGRYGVINRGRRGEGQAYAHRLAYEFAHGPIPEEVEVCHRCDVPLCVNPAHLFLAAHGVNVQDMVEKSRQQHGERHYAAKLTEDEVRRIREMVAGGWSHRAVAEQFGVARSTVSNIMTGHRWRLTI